MKFLKNSRIKAIGNFVEFRSEFQLEHHWKIIGKLFYPTGCDFLDIIVIESAHDDMIVG